MIYNSKTRIQVYKNTKDIPDQWDLWTGNNPFIKKSYLDMLEQVNPCNQRYYLYQVDSEVFLAVSYQLKLNLFTYSKLRYDYPVTIIGIPCSVSYSGHTFSKRTVNVLLNFLQSIKGFKIILNTKNYSDTQKFTKGQTLPNCTLDLEYSSFEKYLAAMRSHYRYRLRKAMEKWTQIKRKRLYNKNQFTPELYELYLAVYKKSSYKLEQLKMEYFQSSFKDIYVYTLKNKPIAFLQTLTYGKQQVFLFCGLNYDLNKIFDSYVNLLIEVIKIGFQNQCKVVELGQTTEEIKLKLGCQLNPKYLYVHHSNQVINEPIKLLPKLISYNPKKYSFRVFHGGRS